MQGKKANKARAALFQIEGFDRPASLVLKLSSLKTETENERDLQSRMRPPHLTNREHDPSTGTGAPSPDEHIIYKPSDSSLPKSTRRLKAH